MMCTYKNINYVDKNCYKFVKNQKKLPCPFPTAFYFSIRIHTNINAHFSTCFNIKNNH